MCQTKSLGLGVSSRWLIGFFGGDMFDAPATPTLGEDAVVVTNCPSARSTTRCERSQVCGFRV